MQFLCQPILQTKAITSTLRIFLLSFSIALLSLALLLFLSFFFSNHFEAYKLLFSLVILSFSIEINISMSLYSFQFLGISDNIGIGLGN